MPQNHVIYGEKSATNTHTDCTQTHTRIAHKHIHGLHTNTHTHGLTQTHTYFYRLSFSPLKHGRKHTHTWSKNKFFWMGAPATINRFAFWGHPGRIRHRKIRYFWHPGRTFSVCVLVINTSFCVWVCGGVPKQTFFLPRVEAKSRFPP